VIRLIIFLAYLRAISFLKEIQRIFQYHGAEHKSIFAFEAGAELTPDRVKISADSIPGAERVSSSS